MNGVGDRRRQLIRRNGRAQKRQADAHRGAATLPGIQPDRAAQGLYQGQAATARLEDVREAMEQAAEEENDHLAWCEERLAELDSRPSLLAPIWYVGSFLIGATAGMAGDKWSLGFVAETEKQVVDHQFCRRIILDDILWIRASPRERGSYREVVLSRQRPFF